MFNNAKRSENLIKKRFAKILEEDIKKVRKVLQAKYSEIHNGFINAKKSKRTTSIDFNIFEALINENCFNNLSHIKKIPCSQMSDSIPTFYDEIIYDLPEDRLNAFNTLFKIPECSITIPHSLNSLTTYPKDAKKLFYLFLYHLFHRLVSSNNSLEQILNDSLIEWRTALNTKKIPITLNIDLDRILIEKNFRNHPFQLKNITHTEITRLSPYKANIHMSQFLSFETEISLLIYESNKNYERRYNQDDLVLIIQIRNEFEKLKDFLCALYFYNYYLPRPQLIMTLPWWIEPENQYLNKLSKKRDDKYEYRESQRLTITDFKVILETYSMLKEKGFYSPSCFPLLFSVKSLAFREQFTLERIFYSHTLLEFLFSPHPPIDLSFKIPINASLLISDGFNEFYQNYILLRGMYKIRSKAIHGEDWREVIAITRDKLNANGYQIRNIRELYKKFDEIILRILNSMINFATISSSIIESLDDSNLVSFRRKKYEYLVQLGDFYVGVNKYIPSLKAFFEAFYIAQSLKDSNKILETGEKIRQMYSINGNELVYTNELQLVLKEISMISNYNTKKQTIAKDIQEKFSVLRSKSLSHPTENNMKLKINGNIIMKELNLRSGPRIGKILLLIKKRVQSGELKNQENILRSYLKTIDLSNLK